MSKFPNEIDTDAELPSVIDGSTEIAGEAINAQKDALLAIERTLGTDPQGSAASLSDRLDVSINPDGTLNSTAIAAAWLLSSPITNAHVSSAAAIDESKINLDVPTALLQDQITDLSIDVEALQNSVGAEVAQLAGHITGTDDRHVAQHIIASPPVASGTSVQTALQNIYAALNDHIADAVGAHDADAVSYSPAPGSNLTASSVGGALDEIDSNFINRVNRHLDTAHSNGISSDGYVYLGGQGAVNSASFGAVPFQPLGGQPRIKIGGINHATLISRGANPAGLGSSKSAVIVDYSDGYSLYTVNVTGLNSVPYPTGSENRLRGVVSKFNEAFRTAGALVTAFQHQNEVVLQHNAPDGYIVVRAPSVASAVDVLGFSAVVGQAVQPISHLISVTDGIPLDAWTALASGTITLSGPSVSLVLSAAVAAGSLLHVVSHTALGGGTYQVLAAVGTSVTLNRPIPAGTFSYSVFPDSLGLGTVSSGTTYEAFVDSSGIPSSHARANITISQISGVRISECRLQPGTYTLSLTGTGSNRSIFLSSGATAGRAATLSQGYLGQLVLEAPLGLGTATLDIVSLSPSSPATDTFTVTESAENDDLQLICSYWSNGSVAEFPVDARNLGLVNSAALATDVFTRSLAAFPSNRTNGFVSGGAPAGTGGTSLQMPASKVMIGGVIKNLSAATIDFAGVPIAYDTYNLYVDLAGSLRLGLESGTGTSLNSILARGEIPVARVVYTGLLDITDTRLFSLPVPPSDRLLVAGSPGTYHCASLAGALLVAEAGSFRKVVVQGDQSVASDLVIPSSISVEGPVALTCRTLSIGAGAAIAVSDIVTTITTPTVVGISALDTGRIEAKNITTRSISLSEYSSLSFLGCSLTGSSGSGIVTLNISGAGVYIFGAAPGATLSFASGGTAAVSAVSDLRITDVSAVFDSAEFDWIAISGVCDRIVFDGLSMQRSGSISAEIGTHSAVSNAGTISSIVMRDCSFAECGKILSNSGTIEFASVSGCSGSNFGGLLKSASSATLSATLSGAALSEFYGYRLYGNILELSGAANVTLSDSVFYGTFGASQTRARAFYSTDTTATPSSVSATISKCTFSGIAFEDYFVAATGLLPASSAHLDISDCAFSAVSSSISQSNRASAAGNLIYWNSEGRLRVSGCSMLSCAFKIAMGYNFELSGNTIEIGASATERQLFNISKSILSSDPAYLRPLARLDENSITVDGRSLVQLSSASLDGNNISADRFIFDYGVSDSPLPLGAGYSISGNSFESTDATAGTGFAIYPGYIVDANKFYGQSTGNLLTLGTLSSGTGFLKFTNNACSYLPPSPAQAILSVEDGTLSGVKYLLSSNIIQLANTDGYAVDNAIQIATNNVVCSQNYIVGDGITGVIFRAVGSGRSGCRMTENVISGGTADGTDLPSDANTFENNRGIANTYSLSPFGALLTGWSFSGTEVSSSTNGAVAWVRIDAPAGELLEVAAGFDFSAVSGSVTLQLYTVSSTSVASTLVGSATLTPTSIGYASASIIPSTAPFIGPIKTAALKITRNTGSATVKLGNIRAVVKL